MILFKEYPAHPTSATGRRSCIASAPDAAAGQGAPDDGATMTAAWSSTFRPTHPAGARLRGPHGGDRGAERHPVRVVRAWLPLGGRGRRGRARSWSSPMATWPSRSPTALARRLGRELWDMRDAKPTARLVGMDAGLDAALAMDGSRAGGDWPMRPTTPAAARRPTAPFHAAPRAGPRHGQASVIGCFWDPQAVAVLHAEAGEGDNASRLRVGGKCGPASGDPVRPHGHRPPNCPAGAFSGRPKWRALQPWAQSAWVSTGGVDLVLVQQAPADLRAGCVHRAWAWPCTIRPLVIVKSSQHFQAAFAPIARAVRIMCPAPAR